MKATADITRWCEEPNGSKYRQSGAPVTHGRPSSYPFSRAPFRLLTASSGDLYPPGGGGGGVAAFVVTEVLQLLDPPSLYLMATVMVQVLSAP